MAALFRHMPADVRCPAVLFDQASSVFAPEVTGSDSACLTQGTPPTPFSVPADDVSSGASGADRRVRDESAVLVSELPRAFGAVPRLPADAPPFLPTPPPETLVIGTNGETET